MRKQNKYADRYIEKYNNSEFIKWKENKISKVLSFSSKVLDIWWAWWTFYEIFKNKKIEYSLVDYNKDLIEFNIKKWTNAFFCDVSRDNLPFLDNLFDFVYISHVFEHLSTDEQIHLFKEIKRVLKTSWYLFLCSPTPYYFTFWDDFTHKRPCTHKQLIWLCDEFWFETIECKYSLIRKFSNFFQDFFRMFPIIRDYLTEVYLIARKNNE